MNTSIQYLAIAVFVVLISPGICDAQSSLKSTNAKSEWVYPDANGKLTYKTLEGGDKIMDFFYAGYMGGGVSIPSIPVKIKLGPLAGDNSDAIQHAIDEVSGMKMVNGFRGAVLLEPGYVQL